MKVQKLEPTYNGFELIQNRTLLGNCINFKPRYMAYADVKREKLQRRKDLVDGSKIRTVYSSRSPLCYIQQRLGEVFSAAFDELEGTEPAIACRKGMDVRKMLGENCVRCAVLVKTDIRRYYDHVTKKKLKECLGKMGFVEDGPEVVSRYLLVRRGVKVERESGPVVYPVDTLQQGSSASPALANVVGKFMFDDQIMEWLNANIEVPFKYYRYSDNITLVLEEDPGQEVIEKYKQFVRELAEGNKFTTHSWATLRPTNKVLSQKFLGIVLNDIASIERSMRDRVKAILYSAITKGVDNAARKYCDLFGLGRDDMSIDEMKYKFAASIRGYAEYVRSVNPRHGARLVKLAKLLGYLVETGKVFDVSRRDLLKRYKIDTEPVQRFYDKIMAAVV